MWFHAQEHTREVSGPILRGEEEQVLKGTCSPCSGETRDKCKVHNMRLRCIKSIFYTPRNQNKLEAKNYLQNIKLDGKSMQQYAQLNGQYR